MLNNSLPLFGLTFLWFKCLSVECFGQDQNISTTIWSIAKKLCAHFNPRWCILWWIWWPCLYWFPEFSSSITSKLKFWFKLKCFTKLSGFILINFMISGLFILPSSAQHLNLSKTSDIKPYLCFVLSASLQTLAKLQ